MPAEPSRRLSTESANCTGGDSSNSDAVRVDADYTELQCSSVISTQYCHPIQPSDIADSPMHLHNNNADSTVQFGKGQHGVLSTQMVPHQFRSFRIAQYIEEATNHNCLGRPER
ncbi:hypothetical protein B0H13DRAFT_2332056 [Mycena leptocephala]|nr:hypothetical protein B0H13DRAFT_2332056 [Mycena leptocephala]